VCESVKLVRSGQEVYAVEMVLLMNTSSRPGKTSGGVTREGVPGKAKHLSDSTGNTD